MKIKDSSTMKFGNDLITNYQFDRLRSIDEIMHVLEVLQGSGVEINTVTVREFDDYEDAPLVCTYNTSNFLAAKEDFRNKSIDNVVMVGVYDTYDVVGKVYPRECILELRYHPMMKQQLEEMFQNNKLVEEKTTDEVKSW